MTYIFDNDSTMKWVVELEAGPDTVSVPYRVNHQADPVHLDVGPWDDGPVAGRTLFGIVEIQGPDRFRVDFEPADPDGDGSERPNGFSDQASDVCQEGELTADYRAIPPPLDSRSALFISGINRSDDLFMFYRGPLDGLTPGARYAATVGLEIATETPSGCLGVGGSPGESVWIKAGVTDVEPLAVSDGSYLRMNIDIGNQSNGGTQAVVLGNVANSRTCEEPRRWETKELAEQDVSATLVVPSDGRAWILIGADSGFESLTQVYFTRASVTLTPL